jgi:hypothetical protein
MPPRNGKTALPAQDVWRIAPSLTASAGGRYERWRAYDGYNLSSTASGTQFPIDQPNVHCAGFSPKFSLAWQASPLWSATGSLARALRFPTVGELYQSVQTGTTFTQANSFLRPEEVRSAEPALERSDADGRLRLSLFGELVDDALITQTSTIPGIATAVSFVQNVDRTRQRGVELVAERRNAFARGLDLAASITYVDATIVANSSYAATTAGAGSVGKRTPYVPAWRATAVATWRPDAQWSHTLAARYSSRVYATVDNSDINPATYQGFESYLMLDARMQYKHDKHWTLAAGIDNINNRKCFLFHPFPQRTVFAELAYRYRRRHDAGLTAGDQLHPQTNEDHAGDAVQPERRARLPLQPLAYAAGEIAQSAEQHGGLHGKGQAQLHRLQGHMTMVGNHELRQEGQEEQHDLGIDRIREESLRKQRAQWQCRPRYRADLGAATAAQRLHAQPEQV